MRIAPIYLPASPSQQSSNQGFADETKGTRLKKHQDACKRGMMEKSAVAEHACENYHLIYWEVTTVLHHGRGQELFLKEAVHIQMTPSLEQLPRWRTGTPWLLDRCDEEIGREEHPH